MPEEYATMLDYVKKLEFSEKPDYMWLRGLFVGALNSRNLENDGIFDWAMEE